ncbi:MAG: hypothetical protein AAF447_17630 [Myxococcota bacterium]
MTNAPLLLQPLADGLWHLEGRVRLAPGIVFPLRSTVIDTGEGLAIVSPLAFDDATAEAIEALGEVRHLISPCLFHHLSLGDAKARWPEATLFAPPGLAKKRPEFASAAILGEVPVPGLEATPVAGMPALQETVFLHRESGTLVTTDLVFNIKHIESRVTRFVLKYVSRAYGRVAQSGLVKWMTKDRDAAAASVETLLGLPFQRLLMAHGEVVETGAKDQLADATRWMRRGRAVTALPSG